MADEENGKRRVPAGLGLARLLDTVDVAVWELDAVEFRMTYVSAGVEQLLGYPRRAWLDEPDFWQRHLHPDDREATVAACLAATMSGRDHALEYRMVAADGRVVWINDLVRIVRHRDSVRACGVMVDVSERKRAEERLRESEEHFRFLVENASDIVAVISPSGEIGYVSPSAARVLGRPAGDLRGRDAFELVHEDDVDTVRTAFFERVHNPGYSAPVEFRLRHADGTWRTVESVVTNNGDGRVLVATRDVTEHRAALALVAERERQLHEMQKLEGLGRLAAGVAHDFNNLLQVIGASAAALQLKLGHDPLRRHADDIDCAVAVAADLTSQLLSFSRGRRREPHAVDLAGVIAAVEPLLRRVVKRDVHLEIAIDGAPRALFERGALEQILMNLVTNAADATEAGGAITVSAEEAGDHIVVAVHDTGRGIAPDALPRVFEPLFTTRENVGGTGLGLAIVKELVQRYGGEVYVESELGRGTTVTVALRRALDH